jgi:hypothetical protein
MKGLVYWAQALDNTSPDHICLRGEQLSPDDTVRRQEAASLVSSVIKSGSRIFDENGVILTAKRHRFVVEIPSAERDHAGRTAPIVCCCDYGGTIDDIGWSHVAASVNDFAQRIGRTIRPEHFEATRRAFDALKKKAQRRNLLRVTGFLSLGLILLILVYLLVSRAF